MIEAGMNHYAHLWLFFALVCGIVVLPGLDMAFVLGSALTGGRSKGLAAVGGIVCGGVCHVLMTALGIGVLLRLVPGAFNVVFVAGALYMAWLGMALLRSDRTVAAEPDGQPGPLSATFHRGLVTSLLNPKAYLFMLAVFPQFLEPAYGALWPQAAILWLIIAMTQACVYGSLAVAANRARLWLHHSPGAGAIAARGVGVLLICAAALTGVEGWRAM
jgi:threonine/homoserine/homoserine lactone efflux protein